MTAAIPERGEYELDDCFKSSTAVAVLSDTGYGRAKRFMVEAARRLHPFLFTAISAQLLSTEGRASSHSYEGQRAELKQASQKRYVGLE